MKLGRREYIILLAAVLLLGLGARIYLEKYTYIFGFDSYWFARMASYVVKLGHIPSHDPLAFRGFPPPPIKWELSMYYPGWLYLLFFGHQYVIPNMLTVFKWLSASFGAIGSVIIGLVGWVIGGPVAGILTGFFAATNPGYAYRTLSGFYEDDATYFMIALVVLFMILAYRAKDWKKRAGWLAAASITALVEAISWNAFMILPYSAIAFLGMFIVYKLALVGAKYGQEFIKKNELATLIGVSLVLAFVGYFVLHGLALREGGDALDLTARVSPTTMYTLGYNVLAVIGWALFAAFGTLYFYNRDRKYGTYALAALLLALLGTYLEGASTIKVRFTLADGTEQTITMSGRGFLPALLGGALATIVMQLAGVIAAFVVMDIKEGKKRLWTADDWWLLAVVFVPLLVATLSGPINGYDWYRPVIHTIMKNINPPNPASAQGTAPGQTNIQPYKGFIEPLTSGISAVLIGENTYGFMNWPAKYGILFLLLFVSLPALAALVPRHKDVLFIIGWLALTWWAAWYQLKYCYYLGIPIAIATGVLTARALEEAKRAKEEWIKVAAVVVVTLIGLSMVSTTIYHEVTRVPTLINNQEYLEMKAYGASSAQDYIDLFQWINNNTPPDANLLNWWNIGHWLTFFTNRGVFTDNTNYYYRADVEAARFFLGDVNTAYAIATKYKMNYVIGSRDIFLGARSLALYALDTKDLRDPRLNNYSVYFASCQETSIPTIGTRYVCTAPTGEIIATLTPQNWEKIPVLSMTTWRDSNDATKLKIGNTEFVVYKVPAGKTQNGIIWQLWLLTPTMNDSIIFRMLIGAPTPGFTPEWRSKDGRIFVYKVDYGKGA